MLEQPYTDDGTVMDMMRAEGVSDEALAEMIAEVESHPDRAAAWHALGAALADRGDRETALALVRRARALDTAHRGYIVSEAQILWDLGHTAEAGAMLTELLDQHPDYFWARARWATLLLASSQPEQATAQADAMVAATPEDALREDWVHALNDVGIRFLQAGIPDTAERVLLRALELDPAQAPPYTNMGILYNETGRPLDALKMLFCAMERQPDNAVIYYNLGRTLRGSAGEGEAYRRVIALDPDYPDVYLDLGGVYEEEGRYEDAGKMYEEAVTRYGDARSYAEYAGFLMDEGRPDQAEANARYALEMDPSLALGHVILGHLASDREDDEEARRQYEEAVRLEPEWWEPHYHLAATCAALRDRHAIIDALEAALRLDRQTTTEMFENDERFDAVREDVDLQALIYAAGLMASMDDEDEGPSA